MVAAGLIEIGVIFFLILVNGLFAMSEIAVVSSRKARLREMERRGNNGAGTALSFLEQPNRLLSTIQIGITTIGIFAGTFGGAAFVGPLSELYRRMPALSAHAGSLAVITIVAAISYGSLVFGELVPKRVALSNPEKIASSISPLMRLLSTIAAPVVRILSASTDAVLLLLHIKAPGEAPVTEEEISDMVEQGTLAGVFQPQEQEMVERVFDFSDLRAHSLMTPRTEVDLIDITESPEKILHGIIDSGHSRFPVTEGDPDTVIGVLNARDLLGLPMGLPPGAPYPDLRTYLTAPLFVPEHAPSRLVLELFRKEPVHFALVIDEYGGFQGVITPYDILKSLVGGLPPEAGEPRPLAVHRGDGSWLIDALLPVADFRELLGLEELPGERERFGTVGGFVIDLSGHLPVTGEKLIWNGLEFEVVDLDGPRIDKIIVRKTTPQNHRV